LFNTPDTTDLLLYGGVGRGAAGAGDDDAASSISSISMSSIRDLMDKGESHFRMLEMSEMG
jgi:hypothetical protein